MYIYKYIYIDVYIYIFPVEWINDLGSGRTLEANLLQGGDAIQWHFKDHLLRAILDSL